MQGRGVCKLVLNRAVDALIEIGMPPVSDDDYLFMARWDEQVV